MAWIRTNNTPGEMGEEVRRNLEGGKKNALLLISGTDDTKEGEPINYKMRMSLKNPQAIAGIIYHHALTTGELAEALDMCDELQRIAATARLLIHEETRKRSLEN